MKPRENPFRISALNSLKVHEVHVKDQKQLINTFKGANDLRNQLNLNQNSSLSAYQKTLHNNTKQFSQTLNPLQKTQSQALMDEIAALDNFKTPVTRDKTKNLIEKIKLRRRQKHIEAYNNFKQDLDDYKENLLQIYESLYNDCSQVLSIKQAQVSGYFNSQTDEYLLSREKDVVGEFESEYENYKKSSEEKVRSSKEELQRIKNSRGSVVDETCEILRMQLIEIAFVLEDEAREIQNKQKQSIIALQQQFYAKYSAQISELASSQEAKNLQMGEKMSQVVKRWRQLKQKHEMSNFEECMSSQAFRNPEKRQQLYKRLVKLQEENHGQKKRYLESLVVEEHVDSLKKGNMEKWWEVVKGINEEFDRKLDNLVKELMEELAGSKEKHEKLYMRLHDRLLYIQNRSKQQAEQMLQQKFQPMVAANNFQAEQMLKAATTYVEQNDEKENTLFQNLYKFFSSIAQNNDEFVKEFTSLAQKYQIQKAKVLDDDEELVDKLTAELEAFKKELRESLHHIKLEEVQKKCFDKIDSIEQAYRNTHEQNKILTNARPTTLTAFLQQFESKIAFIFQLYEQAKRNQLLERNKNDAEKQALKIIDEEDKKKIQEEEKQAQLIKKNGGKAPPPPKPKDPKKAAAELQQRKKTVLAQIGQKKIQELKTGSGNTWLVYKSLETISKEFYKPPAQENPSSQPPAQPDQTQPSDPSKALNIDQLPSPILDTEGQPVTTKLTIFKISEIATYLLTLRDKIFDNLTAKKGRILEQAANLDEQTMEESLTMLDERLKRHFSLKGELQAEIFVKRSGEIANHKKRYEKYARTIREKMDLQTERFNFLLEKSLENLKEHNAAQKKIRQQIPTGKNLSEFQGFLSKARENFNKFTQEINQIVAELSHLSNNEVNVLLQKNLDFIKESRLIKDGGEYSDEEIKWYEEMMAEITTQIKTQKTRRQEKCKQIQEQSEKRKKQLLQKIQKDYHASIEELSAKDGTGKTYGKPKRIAQQKLRLEMNKCEQSLIRINSQIDQLVSVYEKEKSHAFKFQQRPHTLTWRKQLMTLWACVDRYAKHLEALKKDLKIKPMVRVNYDENIPQCTATSAEEDKKLIDQELKALGPLGDQKEDKPFSKFVLDIEKIISDETRTIYVGDKAKHLTGADKLPDFLRKYIASMKQSAEDFRQNSIRQLRESCIRLSQLCDYFNELFIKSIESYFVQTGNKNFTVFSKQFTQIYKKHDTQKTENLRLLRPNLSNPKCQEELKTLNDKELARQTQFIQEITTLKEQFKTTHFTNGQQFMNCLINNYEFLLQYCDSLLLFEDFAKVTGDDDEDKKKLDIKKLMVMKQKGINIDSSSERNLIKKWKGVNFTVINFDNMSFTIKKVQVEDPAAKDPKKAAKKDAKKPANDPEVQENQTSSREIETFKTWRQKGVFEQREKCLESFGKGYTEIIAQMYAKLEESLKENEMFGKKWSKIAEELFLK